MRIYGIPFFCLFLAACSAPPKLEYPTGNNRVPVNVSEAARNAITPAITATPTPVIAPADAEPIN